jgi:hypothetical protein
MTTTTLPFTRTRLGVVYPTDYITSVIDELFEAKHAIGALRQAGFEERHIVLFTNEQIVKIFQAYDADHNLLKSITSVIASVASDEGDYHIFYAAAGKEGHHLLTVYAPKLDLVDRAYDILKQHHAHTMKFFGRWAVTTLP